MKIYIVKAPQGEYEDYCEPIVKVFTDKSKAEEYVKAENAKLPLEQADKCEECLCIGVGDASKNLQAINGILIKLEGEIEKCRY